MKNEVREMNELLFSGNDLFRLVLKNDSDKTIAEYFESSEKVQEKKDREKKHNKKYQGCVKILAKILTSYYPVEEIKKDLFPNFISGKYKASAKSQKIIYHPIVDEDGEDGFEGELTEQEIPSRDEKIWCDLECLYLIFIMSAVESLRPNTLFMKKVLTRVDQRKDFQGTIFDLLDRESSALIKNKNHFMDSIHEDILMIIDVIEDINGDSYCDENDIDRLVSEIIRKKGSENVVFHLSLFYNACMNLVNPDIDDYTEMYDLKQKNEVFKKIVLEIEAYVKFYDDFLLKPSKNSEELVGQLKGANDLKKRRQMYQQIQADMELIENILNID